MGISKSIKKIGPEKKVESEVMAWAFSKGWSLDIFDSKMVFIGSAKRENPGLPSGCSDLVGNTDKGHAVFIELKDPSKDNVCRLSQHQFLSKKIESDAFACVVSSVVMLEDIYSKWMSLSGKEAREFLRSRLPKKVTLSGKVMTLGL